jgi:hypothetical protein
MKKMLMLNNKHKNKQHKTEDMVLNLYDSLSLNMYYKNIKSLKNQMKEKQNENSKLNYENDIAYNTTYKIKYSIIVNTPSTPIDATNSAILNEITSTLNENIKNTTVVLNFLNPNTTNATDLNSGRANETVTIV